MIFDTLAAMADWANDRKFNDNASLDQVQNAIDSSGTAPITTGGANFGSAEDERKTRIFAHAMQTRAARSEIENQMASSSSSSSSSTTPVVPLFNNPDIDAFNSNLNNVYQMEEEAATPRIDAISGNNMIDTAFGNVGRGDGINGYGASMSGNIHRMIQESNLGISGADAWTLSAWTRFRSGSFAGTLVKMGNGGFSGGINLSMGNFPVELSAYLDGTSLIIKSSPVVDQWYHVVLTYDGTILRTYLDSVAGPTHEVVLNMPDAHMLAGNDVGPGPPTVSRGLDELYIWNTVIDSGAIAALYNGGTGTFYQG